MTRALLLLSMAISMLAAGQEISPDAVYQKQIDKARAEYRKAIAQKIRDAKQVELFLLRFDDVKTVDELDDDDVDEHRFPVSRHNASTSVLSAKKLTVAEGKELLFALAKQIEKTGHTGDAFCHFPIHGVRIYSGPINKDAPEANVVYSGTFCWACENFGFEYPDGDEWLDASESLRTIFNTLLPIPKDEKERFERKYPS